MVIVKFISDKDCQLFIDMELVGEVHADNMLKVTLEAGSYLVEAKTTDGKCLKKYELKINSSDNQVLQDLALEKTMLFETIEKLRNDSSLRFYNQRAAFCHNGSYGYINSQYEVVIEPIYSFADIFISTKALVRRTFSNGEMATLIDINGNICLGQWYEYIGCNDKTILLKSENTFFVLSRENYSFVEIPHSRCVYQDNRPSNYYQDSDGIYQPCYSSCHSCSDSGDPFNNTCDTTNGCADGFYPIDNMPNNCISDIDNNSIELVDGKYKGKGSFIYFDDNWKYYSLINTSGCEGDYPYLLKNGKNNKRIRRKRI